MSDFIKVSIKCYKEGNKVVDEKSTPDFYKDLGIPVPKDIDVEPEYEFRPGRIHKDEIKFYYTCADGTILSLKDDEVLEVVNSIEEIDNLINED